WSMTTSTGRSMVVSLAFAGSTSGSSFGAFNPSWQGATQLRHDAVDAGAEATVITDVREYGAVDPGSTVAFVLSPDAPYGANDSATVNRFVRSGGTLVVAEDYGPHANPLLARLGADARVDGRLLRDERHYYRSPNLTVATNVSATPLTAGVDRLTLNHGTAVRPGGARVLVNSSSYVYLDGNRNARLDEGEQMRSYPVATVESVGRGRVVVVGDPSLFINAMLDRPNNRRFVTDLVSGHGTVLLDYSHARRLPPLAAATLLLRRQPALQALGGLFAVVLVALVAGNAASIRAVAGGTRGESSDPSRPDPDRLARAVRRRHPDWERDRVRRVVAGVIYVRREGERDD
ncbi:MAG: DUF4350 domain-containing protein, partial [Salinigranum sp.]